jgi:hypothetical protein
MELLGEWVMWNLVSVHLKTVSVSLQDRCMVCAERKRDSKIVLDAPDGTPRGQGSSGAHFSLFADSANLDARYVHGLRRMC